MKSLSCRLVEDRTAWNEALERLPAYHVLQSWDWGEVKGKHGWTVERLLWTKEQEPVAAAQVLRRPLPYTPWGLLYAPKGPALNYSDASLVQHVLSDLEEYSRRRGAIALKVDPDVNRPAVVEALTGRGWRYSGEQIQFRNTALLDLCPSEDELLAAMKGKTRYNTRLAERRGVTVRAGRAEDIPRFYEMYAETGARDGFTIREFGYYRDVWQTFLESGLGQMLLAEAEGQAIAGLILFRFGEKAWYMYGASTTQQRSAMPNYALQWAAIRWCKAAGCTVYDLWGAPDTLHEHDSMWGVWRFKEGLGAQFAPHIGAYDYPASRLLYRLYAGVLPRYIAWLRRQGKKGQGPS